MDLNEKYTEQNSEAPFLWQLW